MQNYTNVTHLFSFERQNIVRSVSKFKKTKNKAFRPFSNA